MQLSIKAHSAINASGRDAKEITYPRVQDNDLYKGRNHRSSRFSFRNISWITYEGHSMSLSAIPQFSIKGLSLSRHCPTRLIQCIDSVVT
jgi:hypothetical protein